MPERAFLPFGQADEEGQKPEYRVANSLPLADALLGEGLSVREYDAPVRHSPIFESKMVAPLKPVKFFTNYQIHGLLFATYWMVSQGESLYMIDQHAAHERVLYEEFLKKARDENVHAQALLNPIPLRLTPRERQILHENKSVFARFGFETSDNLYEPAILTVPFLIKGPMQSGFFTDLLDKMDDTGFSKESPYTHKTEIIAMAACKAAVKAGDSLSETEARALVKKLLELDNPFTCPHGRPTIIEITKKELERRFKRS